MFSSWLLLTTAYAQPQQPSYYHAMDSLKQLYHRGKLSPLTYFKQADKLAPEGWGTTAYKESLALYEQLAFAADTPSLNKVKYYSYLSIDADLHNFYGRCIYYKEKEIAEYKKLKPYLEESFSMPLFLISLYGSTGQEAKALQAYVKALPSLRKVAPLISAGKQTPESVEQALKVITYAVPLLKDKATELTEAMQLANAICATVEATKDSTFTKLLPRYNSHRHLINFGYFRFMEPRIPEKAEQELKAAQDILLSAAYTKVQPTPEPYLLSEVYFLAAQYYMHDRQQQDSAQAYLDRMTGLHLTEDQNEPTAYLAILAQIARQKGDYKSAYAYMDSARVLSERVRLEQLSDKENNLYAQAHAEEQQLLRQRTEQQRQRTELKLLIAVGSGLLLVVGGTLLVLYLHQKQRAGFAEFKLNMARNIHDETVPALFYARTLARSYRLKEQEHSNGQNELERHLEHTLDTMRSLSHDLKADKHHALSDVCNDVEELLDKLNHENSFTFTVHKSIDASQFIGHYQYVQLKAILNECITNTLKHASFKKIEVSFKETKGRLSIVYKDDGKGWDVSSRGKGEGIGLTNMEERAEQLNGTLSIRNQYPLGYEIQITLPLRDIKNFSKQ